MTLLLALGIAALIVVAVVILALVIVEFEIASWIEDEPNDWPAVDLGSGCWFCDCGKLALWEESANRSGWKHDIKGELVPCTRTVVEIERFRRRA